MVLSNYSWKRAGCQEIFSIKYKMPAANIKHKKSSPAARNLQIKSEQPGCWMSCSEGSQWPVPSVENCGFSLGNPVPTIPTKTI